MTDSAVADHAADDRRTRRALLGAGVLGTALAMASGRTASATPGLPDSDVELLAFAISLELTARDLYDAAIEAGAEGSVWTVMREQHEGYAQALSGISGLSADTRDDAVYDALLSGFRGATSQAAFELENVAAATHTELLASLIENEATSLVASIAAIESRHAVVLATQAGLTDFDSLFSNSAAPLSPEA